MPAVVIQHTDPSSHPSFIREQRQLTAILVRSLVSRGRPEHEARLEAAAILSPIPARREPSRRWFGSSRRAGA
jgi:hypothetical protein